MTQPIALIVEDEPQIRRFVCDALQAQGWQVFEADGVRRGVVEAGTRHPELMILDLGLPDGDGLEVITQVRIWSSMPIIVLSARQDEVDKVAALDAGADDYLTKPFGTAELLARVRANRRRHRSAVPDAESADAIGPDQDPSVYFGEIAIDRTARIVRRHGEVVHLTPTEYRLLNLLVNNAGRVLTHRQILREVWGPSHAQDLHYVRIYMGHLRQKLEIDPAQPQHLQTETAIGYRLVI